MILQVWRRSVRFQLAITAAALAIVATLLVCFPPERYAFYPRCPFHEWLGLKCPGCGMTRAIADLLAGHFREAAELNAMVIPLLPVAVGSALMQSYSVLRWNRWRQVRLTRGWVAAYCAVVLMFGLVRNLSPVFWTIR